MKKNIFGVFAHPDDEAFGPAGTLLKEVRDGADLHLILLTNGNAGTNPDNLEHLGKERLDEWRRGGKLLGAKSMHYLNYNDGKLNNQAMIEIEKRIIEIVRNTAMDNDDAQIELMSLDLNGYTGHIDHIVAARAASFAFYTLKKTDPRLARIRYACLPRQLYPIENTDWIFMEPGRAPEEITETVDARDLREDIIEIMRAHHTQRDDCDSAIKSQGENLGLNYFVVKN
jgi:LmbE family N-acetylglucosaminyl deacetylase